jgi:DNA repair exonuclease SbcCD nuclease subunit
VIFLYLGDPHVQVSNLQESEKLLQSVLNVGQQEKIDGLIILGDLFHNHSVLRTQVLNFWHKWLKTLSSNFWTIVLVGNHDAISNHDVSSHALDVFKNISDEYHDLDIIDSPKMLNEIMGFMPYVHNSKEFIEKANDLVNKGAKVVVCHQEFNGATYENGFYSPHGADPKEVKADLVISGHIHKRQSFDKIIYPGTARWLTSSDANEPKGLWLVKHDGKTGKILDQQYIDTSAVCTPIIKKTWIEGEEMPEILDNSRTTIELVGSSLWINKQKAKLKGKVSITSKITDKAIAQSRKTGKNISDFISNIFDSKTNKEDLLKYLEEKSLV